MSRFEKLIKKHCPDGVEYVPLCEIAQISNGKDHKALQDGKIPVVHERKEEDLSALIDKENLNEDATRQFINGAFRDGTLKTTGTDIDKILPPVSRFGNENRMKKKQSIIDKLLKFFEKYLGLV